GRRLERRQHPGLRRGGVRRGGYRAGGAGRRWRGGGALLEENRPPREPGHHDPNPDQRGDGQDPAATCLGRTPFELPLQFALRRRTPLLVGRHAVVLLCRLLFARGLIAVVCSSPEGSSPSSALRPRAHRRVSRGFWPPSVPCS